MKKALLSLAMVGVALLAGCGGGSTSGGGGGGNTVTLVSIAVTPSTPSVAAGQTQQFTATGNYSDGSTKNLTSSANWLSSNPAVATVNTAGLATAVAAGSTTISASSGSVTGTTTLTVTPTLVSIAVTPANTTIAIGNTQAFTATGTYSDGSTQNLTSTTTWHSSSTSVATITSAGVATGVSIGSTTISATSGSVSGSTTLSVLAPPNFTLLASPSAVTVAQGNRGTSTLTTTVSGGFNNPIALSATGAPTGTTVGFSPNPITAPGAGTSTLTIAVGTGTATGIYPITVTGSGGGVQHTTTVTLTVVTAPDFTLAASPASVSVVVGNQGNSTLTTTVSGGFNNAITLSATGVPTGTTVSFSPNPIAAPGAGSSMMTIAVTTSTAAGTYPITVTGSGGTVQHTTTVTLTVTNPLVSIAVTAPLLTIAQNTSVQFTAMGTYADHSTQNITSSVTWNSSNTSVATISNTQGTQGLATSLNTGGMTQITATMGSVTSPPVTLTVTSATLVSIAVTPPNPQIVYQTQQQFTATGTYSDLSTQDITNSVTWLSSDTTKITITVSGLATGVNTTTSPVTITATDPHTSIHGSTTATVIPPPVVSIAVTPNITTLAQNTSRQYTATATLANGSTLNVTTVATWTSLNQNIATVHSGLVTAQAVTANHNQANIQVSYNGVTQPLVLDVTNATAQTLTVTPVTASIPVGVTQRFIAVATFSDGSSQDVSQNATWSTSPTGIASINHGIATGLQAGTTTVTATFESVNGSAQLTVNTATLQSIVVTPAQTLLAPGSSITYQAVGHYTGGLTFVISGLVTWTSTNTSVVTITSGAVATGQSAGSANISATYQNVTSNSASVVVTSSPLASIAVTPSTMTIPADVAQQFTAIGTFADLSQQNLTMNVTWASSQPAVATINSLTVPQGLATGVAPGQTSITAVFASIVSNQASLTVSNATLVSMSITPNNISTTVGQTLNYRVIGTFSDSSTVDLTNQVTWASSAPSVATINATNGVASTASAGTTVISATFDGLTNIPGMTTNLTVH